MGIKVSLPEFHSSRLDGPEERQGTGAALARHEGDFRGEPQQALSLNELIALLGTAMEGDERSREDAIACYLSGGDGWREAVKRLGGTFAGEEAGLRERKDD
jgi:hypothetical protein